MSELFLEGAAAIRVEVYGKLVGPYTPDFLVEFADGHTEFMR
jgi:hypothetical protein